MRWVAPAFDALGHGVLLQLSSALFDLFMQDFAAQSSWRAVTHSVISPSQMPKGDLLGYLGHTSAVIWSQPKSGGSLGFSLPHFLSVLFARVWLPILLALPLRCSQLLGAIAIILARSIFFSAKWETNNHNCSKKLQAHFKCIVSLHLKKHLQWTFLVN